MSIVMTLTHTHTNIIELIIVIIGVVVIERIVMLTEPGWSFTGR